MSYGIMVNGPFLHFVYTHVYPRFRSDFRGTAQKMLISQTIVSFSSIVLFYTFTPVLKGGNFQDSMKELEKKAWPTMCMNWKMWPLVQLINFTLVPQKFQVVWVNFFALNFNVYLSYMAFVYNKDANKK